MVKKIEIIMLTICAATLFPFVAFFLWVGVLYIEGTCSSLTRDYTFKLNDIAVSHIEYHYDGLNGISKSNVDIITNGEPVHIGIYEDFSDESLENLMLFEKVFTDDNYDVYYFHNNEIYDKKDSKAKEYITPIIIFKDGTIKSYRNSLNGENEFVSSLSLEKNKVEKKIKINIMKNEIEKYYNKEMFLNSWKCLNELEEEREWLNNKINNYYTGKELPLNVNKFSYDIGDSKDKYRNLKDALNEILYLRGDKIFYTKYYYGDSLRFNNITHEEAVRRYNRDYCKVVGNTYDFKDMVLTFNEKSDHNSKILERAEIRRQIFYVNNLQIINEKYDVIKKALERKVFMYIQK